MFSTRSAETSSADVAGQKNGSKAGALPPIAGKPFGARARRRSKLQQQPPPSSSSSSPQNRHEEDSSSSFLLWGSTTEPQKEETRAPVVESSSKNNNSTNVRESVPSEDASSGLAILFGAGGEAKKQRKIVYKTFGNDSLQLLEMVTEDGIPEPESERDVVIKVAVRLPSIYLFSFICESFMFCGSSHPQDSWCSSQHLFNPPFLSHTHRLVPCRTVIV